MGTSLRWDLKGYRSQDYILHEDVILRREINISLIIDKTGYKTA